MHSSQINIRISKDLKETFYAYCEKENLQPSVLIRSWIEEVVKSDKEENNNFESKCFFLRKII